jgi:hypothetical protein
MKLQRLGGLRLTLILFALATLPLVLFADAAPQGIGVFTAYVVPSLVVLFFFVLMLDGLMNRVFMIEQPPDVRALRRLRMWASLTTGVALLVVWGSYFRRLLAA